MLFNCVIRGEMVVKVDKYFEDGTIFDVCYQMETGACLVTHMMFPIDYTEARVKACLQEPPYHLKVIEVTERSYALKMKSAFLTQVKSSEL